MSDLKKEMLKIKVKGYFDNGDLRADPTITVLVKYYIDKARHNIEGRCSYRATRCRKDL